MLKVFYFNPLRECTYVIGNDGGECVIVDPGAINSREQERLAEFIEAEGLQVKAILLTHGTLHLLGYDHDVEERKAVMWKHTDDIIAELGDKV